MTSMMQLDIRVPIGGLFSALGVLVGGYGIATRDDAALYARSLSVNVNAIWGGVLLAFGLAMLAVAFIAARRARRSSLDAGGGN